MSKHSPKNRKPISLHCLEIKITSDEGTITTAPNGKAMMGAYGKYPIGGPVPELVSEISGKPAYRIELDDIELALSFDELDRFFRHDLKNEEFEFLLNKYGMFHEIHDDFYWEGQAVQPIEISPNTIIRIQEENNLATQQPTSVVKKDSLKK